MAQFQDGDSRTINGVTYVRTNGTWLPKVGGQFGAPTLPFQGPQAATNLQKSQFDLQQEEATAEAKRREAEAQAGSAELAQKTAQEQWDINHPGADGSQGMTGPQYLQFLQKTNPGRAAYIQGLSEGRVPFPSSNMMRTPAGQALLAQVMRADPTIDATNYTTRAAARKLAATGTLSKSDNALITAIGHAARLQSLVPDVFGTAITPFNWLGNEAESHLFSGKQPAYDQNAELLGNEVAAAYGANSQGKQNEAGSQFSSSLSKQQKLDNIHGAIDLMASKLAANRAQFAYGNGQLGKPDFMLLPPQTRQEIMSVAPDVAQKYFSGIPVMGGTGAPPSGPSAPSGPSGAPPNAAPPNAGPMTLSTNGADQTQDVTGAAFIDNLVRNQVPYGRALKQYNDFMAGRGMGAAQPFSPSQYNAAVTFARTHPDMPYSPTIPASITKPTTFGERAITGAVNAAVPNSVPVVGGFSPGTTALSALDTGSMGLGGLLAGDKGRYFYNYANANHPGSAFLGNVLGFAAGAGALGKGIGAGAEALADAPVIGRVARGLAARPGLQSFLGNSAFSAGLGATTNPDNPGAGATIGALTGGAADVGGRFILSPIARGIVGKTGGMFGYAPPPALNAGERAVFNPVNSSLSTTQQNLGDAANLGLPYALADASPKLRALAGSAARKNPDVMAFANNTLTPRGLGQADRAIAGINNYLAPTSDLSGTMQDIRSQAQAQTAPLYEQAMSAPGVNDAQLNEIFRTPSGQEAARRAYKIALNRGDSPADLSFSVDASGDPIINATPNWRTLHYTKMGLDSLVEDQRNPVSGVLDLSDPFAQSIDMLRNRFRTRLGELNPDYANANAAYKNIIDRASSMERGYNATAPGVSPAETQFAFNKQSPDSAPSFQQGYASSLADTVNNTRFAANPFSRIYGSPAQQAKVATLFPQAPDFDRLYNLENDMNATRQEVLGGSQTAARTQADKAFDNIELGNAALKGVASGGASVPFDLAEIGARKGLNGLFSRMNAHKAAQIGPILLNQDPSAASAAVNDMIAKNALWQRYLTATRNYGGMFGASTAVPLLPRYQQ